MSTAAVFRSVLVLLLVLPSCRAAQDRQWPRESFKVASVQFNPAFKELDGNLEKLAARFEEAAQKGAKVIVAPEMATTGYLYESREDIEPFVDTIPGKTTERFSKISRKYGCYLAWGMAEVDSETGLYYNSSALVGPKGYVGRYRKTHLWEAEAHWAAWGNEGIPVFETRYGKLSLIICQDANHIETFRTALIGGADLVCFMTNSSGQTIGHLQARAIQNGLTVVSANRSLKEKDFEMKGSSAVWSSAGKKLAEAGVATEETVYAEVDPKESWRGLRLRMRRKPTLYMDLATRVGPWDYTANTQPREIHAVALQYEPVLGSKIENLGKVKDLLKAEVPPGFAERPGGRLIVLPELSFTGPVLMSGRGKRFIRGKSTLLDGPASRAAAEALAESVGGRMTLEVAEIARAHEATVVFGLIERDQGMLYNTAVALTPEGKVLGKARKVHLSGDDVWATPGRRFRVFDSKPLGKLGLLVGGDAYVPEAGVLLAIKRADVVAIPSSWYGEVAGKGDIAMNPEINPHASRGAMVVWDDLATTCAYWAVVANFAGSDWKFGGRSGIYSVDPIYGIPSPGLAGTSGDEAVVGKFTTLAKDHWITQGHYVNSRRSDDLYYPLLKKETFDFGANIPSWERPKPSSIPR